MTFNDQFAFAEIHMPEVRKTLGDLPSRIFFDIETAPAKRDMEEATDLVLSPSSGDIAVRIRRKDVWSRNLKFQSWDWSIRAKCRGHITEIHKLRSGYCRWYFMGFSADNAGTLAGWWLIDMNMVRRQGILDQNWQINPNYPPDGTAGMYIPMQSLDKAGCIVAGSQPLTTGV